MISEGVKKTNISSGGLINSYLQHHESFHKLAPSSTHVGSKSYRAIMWPIDIADVLIMSTRWACMGIHGSFVSSRILGI